MDLAGPCLFLTGLLAGFGVTLSWMVVPAIKATSDPYPAWRAQYEIQRWFAFLSVIGITGMGIKLYISTKIAYYLLVSGAAFFLTPFTMIAMEPINRQLKHDQYKEKWRDVTHVMTLINQWANLQYFRTAAGLFAFAVNVWIVCNE